MPTEPSTQPAPARSGGRYADAEAVARALRPSYPVYLLRPHRLAENARAFLERFPGTVLYAVKCNPAPQVLRALYQAGIRHFDTASLPEIAQISETYPEAHTYFMHPVKGRAVIRTAYEVYGVRHFVVDHASELEKVLEEAAKGPREELTILVRLTTPPAAGTLYHLAAKFGCSESEAVALLRRAHAAGCHVGLAFHVGSQCRSPGAYGTALEICGRVAAEAGVPLACLDVGGGFPADYVEMVAPELDLYFDEIRRGLSHNGFVSLEVFCEPGRALVASGCSLLIQVQLRKDGQLYVNDGIYGSLSEMVDAGIRLPVRLVRPDGPAPSDELREFTVNGPTCDSLDVLPQRFLLPDDVREGDWIEVDQIGAYSNALATHFNGFFPETFVTVEDAPLALRLDGQAA
jgi:ornithine decarboxylase